MRAITSYVFVAAMLLPLAANAQMSEQDRQNRCANNTQAIETAEAKLNSIPGRMSDEEIALARADLLALRTISAKDQEGGLTKLDYEKENELIDKYKPYRRPYSTVQRDIGARIDGALRVQSKVKGLYAFIAQRRARMTELGCSASRVPLTSESTSSSAACTEAVLGTWNGAFAPPGRPLENHGTVTCTSSGSEQSMDWSGGSKGTWACSGSSVNLTWTDKPSADTMQLSADGHSMAGSNNDGWTVKGTR